MFFTSSKEAGRNDHAHRQAGAQLHRFHRDGFEDFEVFEDEVVGEIDNGFRCLLDGLNPERIAVAFAQIGTGRVALNQTVKYAKERIVLTAPSARTRRWPTRWPTVGSGWKRQS